MAIIFKISPNFSSIRFKLTVTYFFLIIGLLLFSNWYVFRVFEAEYLKTRQVTYLTHANVIAGAGGDYLARKDPQAYYLARNFGAQVQARVLMLDKDGVVFADSFDDERIKGRPLKHSEVLKALAGASGAGSHFLAGDGWVLYVAVPVLVGQEIVGAVFLATDINDIYQVLTEIRRRMLLLFFAGGAGAGLVSLVFAGALTGRLKRLTAAVEKVSGGHLHQRVEARGHDEVSALAGAFNIMSERLEKIDRGRRFFIASASHELKSPLSSIKALAESLILGNERNVDVYKEFLQDINSEVDRLDRLTDDLLNLVRLEEQGVRPPLAAVVISELIAEVADRLQAPSRRAGVTLEMNVEQHLLWPVNKDLLWRVLYNLVENGIKYTPPGGLVQVYGKANAGSLIITVQDNGEGIPNEDLLHIFDKFYRVDKARSRQTGGTGLGLSIVHQAVILMGGQISVTSSLGEGSCFIIKLPGD
ncbi:MAG: HAMP domain-containing sensor histidine kinase [Desulfotomaculaceae bacterium]|nr:HAMP domain-containing sensor histidine kinase [Desulfotomaculaceae bacterium]